MAVVGLDGRGHVTLPDGSNGIALTRLGPVRDEYGNLRHSGPFEWIETKRSVSFHSLHESFRFVRLTL